jgi:flagellar basal body rod protein FlgF
MRQKLFFCYIFIFFIHNIYAGDNDLLNDYKLLYIDLLNVKTYGYKSFYSRNINRSSENINISQGTIQMTENTFDCAIAGEGFFKIRLENNIIAYTRNGQFLVDADGVLVTSQGYPLYESICLGESFLPQSFKITKDHNIYIDTVDESQGKVEIKLGMVLTYKIPSEYLEYYKDAIYTIKDSAEYEEELTFDNSIIQGALELSNYELLSVVLRMYYILSVLEENMIPNIEFKKELLKMQIEKMANDNYLLDKTIFSLNYRIDNIIDVLNNNNLLDSEEEIVLLDGLLSELKKMKYTFQLFGLNITEEYLENKLYYLESIIPFIKLDY